MADLLDRALTMENMRQAWNEVEENKGVGGIDRVFFREFSDKLESRVTVRRIGRPLSYRKLMEVQARGLANVLLGKAEAYAPFESR